MKLLHILRKLSVSQCIVVIAMIVVASFHAKAVENDSPISMADTLYAHGEFTKAAEAYLAIAEVDGFSPQLYFNLANAYAQSGDYGYAMLYYSRARRLDPGNSEIKNNLNYFSSKVEDSNRAELRGKKTSVSPDPETFFQSVNRILCADVAQNIWAVLAVVAFIITLLLVVIYLFCSNVRLRKAGFFGGIVTFFFTLIFLVCAFKSASYYDTHDEAVLIAYKTALLIEPSSDAKPAGSQLCQGTVFRIVAEETDVEGNPTWYKVRLNADIDGWVRVSDVAVI